MSAVPTAAGVPAADAAVSPPQSAAPPPGADAAGAGRTGTPCARTAPPTPTGDRTGHPTGGVADPEPAWPPTADAALAELRRHAQQFVAELAEPVRRLRLRLGDAELEVEWDRPVGPDQAAPSGRTDSAAAPRSLGGPSVVPPAASPATRTSVRSPMVGTFYRSPQPGAAPFVAVGDQVRPGQVVGIVEAMKLMNEIVADRPGRVVEILAADGQPVEYDQPLVALDPA
ncbi:acetyl-CoA carboxylase biotin carboxyl carrier protein [Verrucosispora sp. WMMD1129]|uniref:acetyl-CoA carboxylase biotin carboxyl carrier protein n=1 Tax=Verrucosispora sp. WMMD1129 TaxID=3016093 RepID=UPI00249CAE96|nr:acetyl-CoA carboxylase biotin carboxyl carrier protein [Verrucosispora sp. WMMD1129]WFE43431.1 acetyl-CoA carboxylase biotin carboxyl carrier protein [Verrucosispora sp. WMMD1129]